jgi:[ribosomal protein S18]-alanine N-acetyltransferase
VTYYVRRMVREDITQVTEIDREAFPSQIPPPNYRHELQNQFAYYVVVCDDARTIVVNPAPVGGVSKLPSVIYRWLKRTPDAAAKQVPPDQKYIIGFAGIWVMTDEAHVTNIAVRERYRGKGFGELLLLSIADLATGLKAGILTLEVRASNIVAQNLYKKYGFEHVGLRRGYYLDNKEDALIMSTETINSASFKARLKSLRESLYTKTGLSLNSINQ